jgi:hypothetical protein
MPGHVSSWIVEAWDSNGETVSLSQCVGKVSPPCEHDMNTQGILSATYGQKTRRFNSGELEDNAVGPPSIIHRL